MRPLPYRLEKRKTAFETKLFSVFADRLVDGGGQVIAPDYLVVAPKSRTTDGVTGIVVVPFVGDKIGLVHVHRHAVDVSGWEVPRGFVDDGETPAEAALRELGEEAGLSCDPSNLVDMGNVAPDPGILDARIRCFVARDCFFFRENEPEFGHREFALFNRVEVEGVICSEMMLDSISLVAYYRSMSVAADCAYSPGE